MASSFLCLLFISLSTTDGFMIYRLLQCDFNSTELKNIGFIYSYYYNKIEFTRFDTSVGKYVGFTEYGVKNAEYWNNLPGEVSRMKAEKERYCKTNADIAYQSVLPKSEQGSFVYNKDQLLALRPAVVLPADRPDIPSELRRKRWGCRAGKERRRPRRRRYRPSLPSVIIGNVRSLPNKMDELTSLTWSQREYRQCSIMMLTESWLTPLTPDTSVTLPGFQLLRADRTRESVPPTVKLHSSTPPSGHHPAMLVCSVYDFYPKYIKVSWHRDGEEVTSDVTSTEEMADGDWYYQTHSHLEYTPRSGEKISCVVEHSSLEKPLITDWDPSMPESERNKLAIGASGLILGLILSLAGFIYYRRKARGRILVPTN